MASTPSSSALSAVLRCRGNIWARNPPSRRPAASVNRLGPAGGGVRDTQPERDRPHQAFLQEERVLVGRKPPRVGGRERDYREIKKSSLLQLSQTSRDAHGAQNASARHHLRGTDPISRIDQITEEKTCACKMVFVQGVRDLSTGLLKVSIRRRRLMGDTGPVQVKRTCFTLTCLVSESMCVKLEVVRNCGRPLQSQRGDDATRKDTAQANGLINNPTDLNSSRPGGTTEDRPV